MGPDFLLPALEYSTGLRPCPGLREPAEHSWYGNSQWEAREPGAPGLWGHRGGWVGTREEGAGKLGNHSVASPRHLLSSQQPGEAQALGSQGKGAQV